MGRDELIGQVGSLTISKLEKLAHRQRFLEQKTDPPTNQDARPPATPQGSGASGASAADVRPGAGGSGAGSKRPAEGEASSDGAVRPRHAARARREGERKRALGGEEGGGGKRGRVQLPPGGNDAASVAEASVQARDARARERADRKRAREDGEDGRVHGERETRRGASRPPPLPKSADV